MVEVLSSRKLDTFFKIYINGKLFIVAGPGSFRAAFLASYLWSSVVVTNDIKEIKVHMRLSLLSESYVRNHGRAVQRII